MSRSQYADDCDNNWATICYRGAVARAIRGKRGQSLLREMLAALDSMPDKRLISHALEEGGAVCALGAVGRRRGIDMGSLDPEDPEQVAGAFQVSGALVREIAYENDEWLDCFETPEHRWRRMRDWVVSQLREVPA